MKKSAFSLILTLAVVMITGNLIAIAETTNSLAGKIIALDAGHGGADLGAQYPAGCADDGDTTDCLIYEKDVNLAVVNALESKLTVLGAKVVIAERYSTRRERVNDAVAQCASLDANDDGTANDGRKCDVLVSVHHNGSTDPTYDGTLTIYTQKSDKPLAQALLATLWPLTGSNEGMLNGGYGMTVYKNLVSTITEAYYITNDCEAELYLYKTTISPFCNKTIYPDGDRIDREANLQVQGLTNYFASQSSGGNGGKPR